MEYVYLGRIVNTHGIKGEVRIISDFERKSLVFKKDFKLYIGNTYNREVINSYRIHKNYDMITFKGINDINDVLKYKGKKVYIKKDEFEFPGILNEDLIGVSVYASDKLIGKVKDIYKNVNQELLILDNGMMIPFVDEFVKGVSKERIDINLVKGLIDED